MVEVMKMPGVLQSIHGVTKSWTGLSNGNELNENNGDLLQKVPCMCCYIQCPQP